MRQSFFADNNLDSAVEVMREILAALRTHDLSTRSLFLAELVLEEILTNIIKYAYDDQEAHRIEVVAQVRAGRVLLELRDDGHHFDPCQAPVNRQQGPVSKRTQGGYGIELVRRHVDHFSYERTGFVNILRVEFPSAADETSPKS